MPHTSHFNITVSAADIAEAVFHCAHSDSDQSQSWKLPTVSDFDYYYVAGSSREFRAAAARLTEIANIIDYAS